MRVPRFLQVQDPQAMKPVALLWLGGYVGVIAAANYATDTYGLVPIGFGLMVTAGTFFAGAALILRDAVQVTLGKAVTWLAIGTGIVLSYLLASPALALASACAFAASELVDLSAFSRLRSKSLALAVLVSSVLSAPVDTVLFLWIAGFPVTWDAVLGQFIVKTVMALVVAGVLEVRHRRCVT